MLEQFDFTQLPQFNRALLHDLATGRYVQECVPVLIVGPCCTGKSHQAQALGHCAIRKGVDMQFTTCSHLTQSLYAARATGAYQCKLSALARIPLLILDDFGLKPLRALTDEDVHDLIAERYERTATIVTSNLDFPDWNQAFPANQILASSTLDRLRHNAYCLVLDGRSYSSPRTLLTQGLSPPKKQENRRPNPYVRCPFNHMKVAPLRRSSVGFFDPVGDSIHVDEIESWDSPSRLVATVLICIDCQFRWSRQTDPGDQSSLSPCRALVPSCCESRNWSPTQ